MDVSHKLQFLVIRTYNLGCNLIRKIFLIQHLVFFFSSMDEGGATAWWDSISDPSFCRILEYFIE